MIGWPQQRGRSHISLQPVDSHVAHMYSRGRQNHRVNKGSNCSKLRWASRSKTSRQRLHRGNFQGSDGMFEMVESHGNG